jgi:NAD(P)-dependent dehydrogenase (short-subunit alcohol dehydrogenase family)
MTTIKDKTVLVTGANRGIGQALAAEALARGARRVYAGTRQPLAHPDDRVTPLSLDVTSTAQIQAAAGQVESLDMLINNAGIALGIHLCSFGRRALTRSASADLHCHPAGANRQSKGGPTGPSEASREAAPLTAGERRLRSRSYWQRLAAWPDRPGAPSVGPAETAALGGQALEQCGRG